MFFERMFFGGGGGGRSPHLSLLKSCASNFQVFCLQWLSFFSACLPMGGGAQTFEKIFICSGVHLIKSEFQFVTFKAFAELLMFSLRCRTYHRHPPESEK